MKRMAEGASRIFLACGATDFRKQIPGLVASVSMQFRLDPYQGDLQGHKDKGTVLNFAILECQC